MKKKLIYLDNATTSYPKPKSVGRAIESALHDIGTSPGRSGYGRGRLADRYVYDIRVRLARFFNLPDPSGLIFTPGGTFSLNMAIKGYLEKRDHIIITGREHNSVIRPISDKKEQYGITSLKWDGISPLAEKDFKKHLRGNTRAILVNHASNVDGLLYPVEKIGRIAKKLGLALILDAAQTAGLLKIDMVKSNIDLLCVTGHKGMWGPQGIGLLAVAPGTEIKPIIVGGTGSFSEDVEMPSPYPDRLEPGTANLAGIAGLSAGLKEVQKIGIKKIFQHKMGLALKAYEGLKKIDKVKIYWGGRAKSRIPLFSFAIDGVDPALVGDILDRRYNIACRVGLHCAPMAHRELGTYPQGTIRFAPGYYTKTGEINTFVKAIARISETAEK